MGWRYETSPGLRKRVNLLAPLGLMIAVNAAQWMLGARRPIGPRPSPLASADSVAGDARPDAATASARRSPVYLVLINLGVVMIVAGLAAVLSVFLFAIPVPLLVAAFAVACWYLLLAGLRAAARGSPLAGMLFAWAAIAFALVVFAGAQLAGRTGFVPDLVLVWLAGILAVGLAVPSMGLLKLTGATVIAWVYLAYLYDRSYLAAVAALIALYWGALRRPTSGTFVTTISLATVVVAGAYFHDLIQPAHYPLAPGAGELLFAASVVGAVGALWAVATILWSPARIDTAVSTASRRTVRGFGYALLATVALRPLWDRIRDGFDHSGTALTAGTALLVFAAILMWSTPTTTRDRLLFIDSTAKFVLLAGALYGVPAGFGTAAPLLAALALGLAAYRLSATGASRGDAVRVSAGVLLLLVIATVTLAGWHAEVEAAAPVLGVLGVIVLKIAHDWNGALGHAPPGLQPEELPLAVSSGLLQAKPDGLPGPEPDGLPRAGADGMPAVTGGDDGADRLELEADSDSGMGGRQ